MAFDEPVSHDEVVAALAKTHPNRETVRELALRIVTGVSTVRHRMNDLVERGWVDRATKRWDSRVPTYQLTEAGLQAHRDGTKF